MFLKKNIKFIFIVSFLVFLSSCERAKEISVDPPSFRLVSPKGTVTEVKDDTQLAIAFTGRINTSAIKVFLNGVDITSQMSVSPTATYALLKDLTIQAGKNDIRVVDTSNRISKTFSIYIDNLPPEIAITSITPSSPAPGSVFRVRGDIVDVSPVTSLVFIDATGTHDAMITGTAPNQSFDVLLTYPNRADASYTPNTDPLDTFDPKVHWLTTAPDISYTITDESGQSVTRNFVAKESRFANSVDGFVSYSMLDLAEYLFAKAAQGAIATLVSDPLVIGSADDPFIRAWPSGNRLFPYANPNTIPLDPSDRLQRGVTSIDFSTCAANGYCPSDINATYPDFGIPSMAQMGNSYCNNLLFDDARVDTCAIYITRVEIDSPSFGFGWDPKKTTPTLDVIGRLPYAVVDISILGLKYASGSGPLINRTYTYQGKFKTSVELKSYQLQTAVEMKKGKSSQPTLEAYVPMPDTTDLIGESGGVLTIDPAFANYSLSVSGPGIATLNASITANFSNICISGGVNVCTGKSEEQIERIAAKAIRKLLVQETQSLASFGGVGAVSLQNEGFSAFGLTVTATSSNLTIDKQSFGDVLTLTRKGDFRIEDADKKKPQFDKTSCDVCRTGVLSVEFLEFIYNLGFLDSIGRNLTSMIASQAEQMAGSIVDDGLKGFQIALDEMAFGEKIVAPPPPVTIDRVVQFDLFTNALSLVKAPFFEGGYAEGVRFTMMGNVKAISQTVPAKETGLGSRFVNQGSHNDWMFHDKITPVKKPIAFAFSLSSNIINQYFLASHESGIFDGIQLNVEDIRFTGATITVPVGHDFRVTFSTTNTPIVELIPFQKQISYGGCVQVQGIGNCGSSVDKILQREIQPQIMAQFPALDIIITDTTTGTTFLEARVDLTLNALVQDAALVPRKNAGGEMSFARVRVVSINTAASDALFAAIHPDYVNAQTAELLEVMLNDIGSTTANLLAMDSSTRNAVDLFGNQFTNFLVGTSTLPFEVGLVLDVLEIDPGGDFVNIAGSVKHKKISDCMPANFPSTSSYLTATCIQ